LRKIVQICANILGLLIINANMRKYLKIFDKFVLTKQGFLIIKANLCANLKGIFVNL